MQKWSYYVARVTWRKRRTGAFFPDSEKKYVFQAGDEYTLQEGLDRMGEQGYELVAVHPENLRSAGDPQEWFYPTYVYVFKRPRPPQEESPS